MHFITLNTLLKIVLISMFISSILLIKFSHSSVKKNFKDIIAAEEIKMKGSISYVPASRTLLIDYSMIGWF